MGISEHIEKFDRYDLIEANEFEDYGHEEFENLDLKTTGVRISVGYEEDDEGIQFNDVLAKVINEPHLSELECLVIGGWNGSWEGSDSTELVEALVGCREELPLLRALFLGEMTYEDCEISWINQSDLSPLFSAYPQLEILTVRGSNGLSFGSLKHANLQELEIQCGGMPQSVLQEIASADLPKLHTLKLWLGTDRYGRSFVPADLTPILSGKQFPLLKHLGLMNDETADQTVAALVASPIYSTLETLDLSLGNLSDVGAVALLSSPHTAKLKGLDVSHHYLSEAVAKQIQALDSAFVVGTSEGDADPEDRYIACGE